MNVCSGSQGLLVFAMRESSRPTPTARPDRSVYALQAPSWPSHGRDFDREPLLRRIFVAYLAEGEGRQQAACCRFSLTSLVTRADYGTKTDVGDLYSGQDAIQYPDTTRSYP